ncbi:MAG: ExsB family transcriptional regulator, partial [Candidatus Omnitrophica bacterium]|nr:ExsB family transcriptional regulator [Candidatus Omnitrophota bacterium]
MDIQEIKTEKLDVKAFIREQVSQIASTVGKGIAINALSGGVDSSTVTMLGHKAIGKGLKTYFIDHGLMRQNEPQRIVSIFRKLGVRVELVDGRKEFFNALKGLTDPEEKREAITQAFYKDVFRRLVKVSGARYLLQGTNYTDVEETVAGVKRQHNILEQLGIDTQREFGYRVIEPLIQLRKSGVRKVAKALGLPKEIYARPPFPGPALSARIIGEVTSERVDLVKKATAIVEEVLEGRKAF